MVWLGLVVVHCACGAAIWSTATPNQLHCIALQSTLLTLQTPTDRSTTEMLTGHGVNTRRSCFSAGCPSMQKREFGVSDGFVWFAPKCSCSASPEVGLDQPAEVGFAVLSFVSNRPVLQ